MNSKEKIRDIKSVINEFYHQMKCEGKLTECANECWKSYQKYCDDIEKDLKQTKLNFRNSQTHSKNCYKKLKEKYVELQYDYNNFQKDFDMQEENYDQLIEKFLESEKENQNLKDEMVMYIDTNNKFYEENTKLKKALDIYKTKYIHNLYLRRSKSVEEYNKMTDKFSEWDLFNYLTQEEYELLKGVLE